MRSIAWCMFLASASSDQSCELNHDEHALLQTKGALLEKRALLERASAVRVDTSDSDLEKVVAEKGYSVNANEGSVSYKTPAGSGRVSWLQALSRAETSDVDKVVAEKSQDTQMRSKNPAYNAYRSYGGNSVYLLQTIESDIQGASADEKRALLKMASRTNMDEVVEKFEQFPLATQRKVLQAGQRTAPALVQIFLKPQAEWQSALQSAAEADDVEQFFSSSEAASALQTGELEEAVAEKYSATAKSHNSLLQNRVETSDLEKVVAEKGTTTKKKTLENGFVEKTTETRNGHHYHKHVYSHNGRGGNARTQTVTRTGSYMHSHDTSHNVDSRGRTVTATDTVTDSEHDRHSHSHKHDADEKKSSTESSTHQAGKLEHRHSTVHDKNSGKTTM